MPHPCRSGLVRAGRAAWWCSWRMPPSRARRRMSRWVIRSGSSIGAGSGWVGEGVRKALVRPVLVAERLELAQGVQKMALVPDQCAAQQLSPAGRHPPLHDRVRSRCPDAAEHHLDTRVLEVRNKIFDGLDHPGRGWMRGRAQDPDPAVRVLDRGEQYERAPDRVPASKKSHARSASAWGRRKPAPVLEARSGAGSLPASFRISQTADAAASPRTHRLRHHFTDRPHFVRTSYEQSACFVRFTG
ncbi:hypothetical protein ACVW19_000502 [Streptomyces sp. TE5632]